jgi:ATP-binding cassette, subfamily F, member 3
MLQIKDLTFRFGGRLLFDGASVTIPGGHKVGLVGRNGTGKSTLLRLITGEHLPDGGSITVPARARLASVAQTMPGGSATPLDFVLAADVERTRLLAEAETVHDGARQAEVHARLADINAASAPSRAASVLAGLGFDEAAQNRPLDSFSGGWRMRVALAATLFLDPDILLLDEPNNHLDLEARLWLESHLAGYGGTLLLVSHDRALLNSAVDAILNLEHAKLTLYTGGYDRFEATYAAQRQTQAAFHASQEAQRKHIQAFVDRFRYKASKARQAQSRLKALARLDAAPPPPPAADVRFDFPSPDRVAPPLLGLDEASVGYRPGQPVLRRLGLRVDMEDRIALLGANGNGKTTLLRLIAGALQPESGHLTRSSRLRVGYFAQEETEAFELDRTALSHMASLMGKVPEVAVRAHLGRFGLGQEKADQAIGSLSGGEKARLLLAGVTRAKPHLLLLDEPTNHLDLASRDALVEALNDFSGAVILVTHDLHLIELCAERLWLVADGTCRPFEGDIDDYRRLLAEARRADKRTERVGPPKVNRREQRRQEALARIQRGPLHDAARQAEKRVEKLTRERRALLGELADPGLYQGNGEAIVARQKRAAELDRKLAEAEAEWLQAQEALETAMRQTAGAGG